MLVRGLVQANNEPVQDFFDRVALAMSKVHQNHREALTGAEVAGQKKGYDKSLDVTLGTLFASGLKAEIREYVECNMKEGATSEDLLDLAEIRIIERARHRSSGTKVSNH